MPKFGSQPPAYLPLLSLIIPPAPAPHDHPVVKPSLFSFALPRVDHEPSLFILIAVWGRACPPSLNLVGTGRNNKETEIRKESKGKMKEMKENKSTPRVCSEERIRKLCEYFVIFWTRFLWSPED